MLSNWYQIIKCYIYNFLIGLWQVIIGVLPHEQNIALWHMIRISYIVLNFIEFGGNRSSIWIFLCLKQPLLKRKIKFGKGKGG